MLLSSLLSPGEVWSQKKRVPSPGKRVNPLRSPGREDKPKAFPRPAISVYTDNSLLTAFELEGDTLWTGSMGELRSYDLSRGNLLKRHRFAGDVFISYIYAVKALKGRVWVATDVGLFSIDKKKGTWERYFTGKDLPEGEIEAMDADRERGVLWLAVRKSMYMGEGGDIRLGFFDLSRKKFRGMSIGSDFIGGLVSTGKDVWLLTSFYGEEGGRLIRFGKKDLLSALKRGVSGEKDFKGKKEEYPFTGPLRITDISAYGDNGLAALYRTEPPGGTEEERKTEIRLFDGALQSTLTSPAGSFDLVKSAGGRGLWVTDEGKVWGYSAKGWKSLPEIPALGKGGLAGILSRGKAAFFILNALSGRPGPSGIYSIRGKKVIDLSQKRELSGGVFSVLLKDSNDNFWIKSEAGEYPYPNEVTRFDRRKKRWDYMNRKTGFKTSRESYHDRQLVYVTEHGERVRLWAYYADREGKVSGLSAFAYDAKDGSLKPEPDLTLSLETSWTKDDPKYVSDIDRVSVIRETGKHIWVITIEGSVLYFDKDRTRWEVLPGKYSSSAVFSNEGVWFAMTSGAVPQAVFLSFEDLDTKVYDLPGLSVQKNVWYQNTGVAMDGEALWVSSGKTLIKLDPASAEAPASYTADAMEENASISYILPYGSRYLILGLTSASYEEGASDWLWVFDKEKVAFLPTGVPRYLKGLDFGPAFPMERHLIEGERLWLGTSKGVFMIDLRSLFRGENKR